MKRITVLLLIVALMASFAVAFTGCDDKAPAPTYPVVNNPTQPVVNNPTQVPTEPDEKPTQPQAKPTEPEETEPEEEEVSIVGEWTTTVDITDAYNMMLAEGLKDSELGEVMYDYLEIDEFSYDLVWEFKKNGKLVVTTDEDDVADAIDGLMSDLEDGMTDFIEYIIEESGADYTVEKAAEEMFGMSVADYVAEMVEDYDIDLSDVGTEQTGEYELDGDELCIELNGEEMCMSIHLTKDEMEITNILSIDGEEVPEGFWEEYTAVFPEFIFERQ